MWIRGVAGVVLIAIGGVWVAQGTGALAGSMMSGHGQYAVLGAVAILAGAALLALAWRRRSTGTRRGPRD
jgi:hypothetical protein